MDPHSSLPPILIVDDEPGDVFVATRLIAKANVRNPLITARDGEEAISMLERAVQSRDLPRLVLLDIRMPRVDGFDVLRWIRQQAALKFLPVVMFTTSCLPEELRRAAELGASHWCEKFPSVDKFRTLLEAC